MDLSALIRHIVATHHRYVREHQPVLQGWLAKLADTQGAAHPELHQVRAAFAAMSHQLFQHLDHEENVLFPCVEALCLASETQRPFPASAFGTTTNLIRAMEQDHREAGKLLARLRLLTNDYQPPDDGCTTYRACYAALARFEADLQEHLHLENDVLFPRAIALENEL